MNEIGDKLLADPQGERPRRGLLDRLVEAQQRAVVPVPQVRLVVGHEQHGPPGAHLPLDHGGRRGEHLGLRRDDQLVQRHAELQVHVVHRLNAAEAHPVSMLHALHAKENGAKMIVVDPRFTRTAARADQYVRIRSGTDVAFLFGMLYHIFKNGWEDKQYINDRVYGMDKVREDVMKKWTPGQGDRGHRRGRGRRLRDRRDPWPRTGRTIMWCMGQTQHTNGNAIVRASCILQLALGNIGKSGGGANIYRGHDNVQGATDVGPNPDSLPGYYGIARARGSTGARSGASTTNG
jgi:anaerobic selenocysteine-containing dehydrogenase